MPRRAPYGSTPAERLAWIVSLPARRWALQQAARAGSVHTRDLLREFPEYGDHRNASDVLHVLLGAGLLQRGGKALDINGHRTQQTFQLTPLAYEALRELLALLTDLSVDFSPAPEVAE